MAAVRGFVGSCGSGKTWTMQALVAASCRAGRGPFVVLDLNAEWVPEAGGALAEPIRKVGGSYRWSRAKTAEQAAAALAAGHSLVIVHPDRATFEAEDAPPAPLAPLADELGRVCIDHPTLAILCLPEAHTSAREHYPLPASLRTIAHRHRHTAVRAGIWWDTQHFADVSKDLERASGLLYLFANAGHADRLKLQQLGGRELAASIEECGTRASGGAPGWHVRLDTLSRRPPFELRRV